MFKRIKRIRSHAGHYRYLHECTDAGTIPRQPDIPSPYAYSPDWQTYTNQKGQRVVIIETSHRCFDVFEVPATCPGHGSDLIAGQCPDCIIEAND